MKRKLSLVLVITMVLSLALTGCGSNQPQAPVAPVAPEEIKIGSVFPMTGAIATFGQSSLNGTQLAFEEINNAGGVLGGRKLVLINSTFPPKIKPEP